MVRVLSMTVLDHGCTAMSNHTENNKIGIDQFSAKHSALLGKSKY